PQTILYTRINFQRSVDIIVVVAVVLVKGDVRPWFECSGNFNPSGFLSKRFLRYHPPPGIVVALLLKHHLYSALISVPLHQHITRLSYFRHTGPKPDFIEPLSCFVFSSQLYVRFHIVENSLGIPEKRPRYLLPGI